MKAFSWRLLRVIGGLFLMVGMGMAVAVMIRLPLMGYRWMSAVLDWMFR